MRPENDGSRFSKIQASALAAWLTEWSSPKTLEAGAMSGAILESWIVSEISIDSLQVIAKFGCVTPNLFPVCITLRGTIFFAVCTRRNKKTVRRGSL